MKLLFKEAQRMDVWVPHRGFKSTSFYCAKEVGECFDLCERHQCRLDPNVDVVHRAQIGLHCGQARHRGSEEAFPSVCQLSAFPSGCRLCYRVGHLVGWPTELVHHISGNLLSRLCAAIDCAASCRACTACVSGLRRSLQLALGISSLAASRGSFKSSSSSSDQLSIDWTSLCNFVPRDFFFSRGLLLGVHSRVHFSHSLDESRCCPLAIVSRKGWSVTRLRYHEGLNN